MKKALFIIAVALLCLTGCQGNTATDAPAVTATPTAEPTAASKPTATPTPEPTATTTPEPTATPEPTPTPTSTPIPEYPMEFTGYYTDDSEIINWTKSILGDSDIFLSTSREGQQKIDELENRITEIESTSTSIVKADTYVQGVSYCGTAYYVDAENGDDSNDGLSPETAFRTVRQIDFIELHEGDAVFFKRGGIYYDACPTIQNGVTYSAYGEGAKPILTPSSNDANNPANWVLYYESGEQKIWQYQKTDFSSVGWIDFNCSNDLYAYPVYEYWSSEAGYQYIENVYEDYDKASGGGHARNRYGNLASKEIHEMLTDNLTFVSRTDYKDFTGWHSGTNLYLRCDEGNPAEVFDVIKFTAVTYNEYGDERIAPVQAVDATDVTLDNLELSNGAQWGVGHMNHSTIQNCEVSFIGNTVWFYNEWKPEETGHVSVNFIGDGIYNCVDGMTLRNNYVHHCCCVGIVGENFGESADSTLDKWRIASNVVSCCGQGYVFQDGNGWVNLDVEGIYLTDNYFAHSGQFDGVIRWYNDFNCISVYGWDDTGSSDVYKFLASKQHFTGNTIIGGYDSSFNSVVDGFEDVATFTRNTFVGDPMDNAIKILNAQKVIKYWQLCE